MIEKEVKIILEKPSIKELKELLDKNMIFLNAEEQEDIYFNFVYRNFKISDETVRIRKTNGKIELTYKGPKLSSDLKSREEITVIVKDINNVIEFLQKIGFYPVITIRKTRLNYLDDSFIISLDTIDNLGEFIEIEAKIELEDYKIKNYVNNFIVKYNIKGKLTTKSYLEMFLENYEKNTQ